MSFLWHGLTDQGVQVPVQVDDLGRVVSAPSSSVGASAWARFSPSDPGTILRSFNVASINKSGEGVFNVQFIQPMPHADYACAGAQTESGSSSSSAYLRFGNQTVTGLQIRITGEAGNLIDKGFSFVVFSSL